MINIILIIICAIFDLFILITYIKAALPFKKENISSFFYCISYITAEGILFIFTLILAGEYSPIRGLLTIFLGIITTYIITLFYIATMKYRLLIAVLFQVVLALSEITGAYLVIPFVNLTYPDKSIPLDEIVLMASKFIAFLTVIALKIWWNRKDHNRILSYNLLILTTPLISLFLLLLIPYPSTDNQTKNILTIIVFGCLFLINLVNYYLLDNVLQVMKLREQENQLIHQIDFQTNKYQQISSAYRNTRCIMHDVKKHYLYIQNCIDNGKYNKVMNYLSEVIQHLEQNYACINTGNLVIDAFINNYSEMAKQENIVFHTNIQIIAKQVPTNDYDLCVILGNLLDNSINACRTISMQNDKLIEVEIYTSKVEFVIHIKNSIDPKTTKKGNFSAEENLYHGYGIANIQKLVEKYKGIYSYFHELQFYEAIIVIPSFHQENT